MARLVLRVAAMLLGLLVALPLHFLWKLLRRPSPWPRHFLRWVGRCAGLRLRIEGRPLGRDVLFVSNHVTWLDILALGGVTGAAFVSRDDVSGWPVIGWLASLNDTLYVARQEKRQVRGQADALRAALSSGRAVALFPEGTTEGGHEVLPFRPSLFSALFPPLPRVRVQPMAIDYGPKAEEIAWVGEEPAGANVRRILSRRGRIHVVLRILEPVDPHAAGDRKTLAARSRAEVLDALGASEPATDLLYAGR